VRYIDRMPETLQVLHEARTSSANRSALVVPLPRANSNIVPIFAETTTGDVAWTTVHEYTPGQVRALCAALLAACEVADPGTETPTAVELGLPAGLDETIEVRP
jgi:hypothetical protein